MERGGVWAAGVQELGTLGMELMEVGSLRRRDEAGMTGSALLCHWGAPPAGNLLGGLVSKSWQHGRTDVGQMRGQWGTKELARPW